MNVSLYRTVIRAAARRVGRLGSLTAMAIVGASPASASDVSLEQLRVQDQRLLAIAEPILARNARLCDRTMPDLGVALESLDQYPAGARPPFAASVAFAEVLPGSAAARAGIEPGDGLESIDGAPISKRPDLKASPLRDSVFAALAERPAERPLALGVVRAGQRREVTLTPPRECRALVEILDEPSGTDARSDGRVIQIAYGLAIRASDEQIATIFAHELAHAVLHHRERLAAADVSKGLFGELGRNRRLNLQAEEQADRLSVHLLANAGYDPHVAAAFWRSKLGRQLSGGLFHDRMHLSAKSRAQMLDDEIAAHLTGPLPSYPAELLATRNQPLR